MPSALEYFEKCAGQRTDNYLLGGTGYGLGADAALGGHGEGMTADDLDAGGLSRARHRGRALEAIGTVGLGALGGLGLAAYHHPMHEWFDSGEHAGNTLHDMGIGATVGSLAGGYIPPAIHGYNSTNKLIEEAKRRRATANQAPDLPASNVGLNANSTEGNIGGEAVPQM